MVVTKIFMLILNKKPQAQNWQIWHKIEFQRQTYTLNGMAKL